MSLLNANVAINETSGQVIFSSKLSWNLSLRLAVLIFSLTTNSITIVVFMNSILKDICYKYMLATSITNLAYLLINILGIFFYYCTDCWSSHSYPSTLFSIVFTFYLSNCLLLMRILLEVTISLRTFFILANKSTEWLNYKVSILVLLVVSLLFYVQVPFAYGVNYHHHNGTLQDYSVQFTQFGLSNINHWIAIGQYVIRIFLAVLFLALINCLNMREFRKRFDNRSQFSVHAQHSVDNQAATSNGKRNKPKILIKNSFSFKYFIKCFSPVFNKGNIPVPNHQESNRSPTIEAIRRSSGNTAVVRDDHIFPGLKIARFLPRRLLKVRDSVSRPPTINNNNKNTAINQIPIEFNTNGSVHSDQTRSIINVTRMVIYASFSNIIGTLPYSILCILIGTLLSRDQIGHYYDLTLAFLNISIGLDLLVYFWFNKLFRHVLKSYFKRVLGFFRK